MTSVSQDTLKKLNRETSTIAWGELQAFYQQGDVLVAAPELDLVAVAAAMVEDDTASVARWLKDGQLLKASAAQNAAWLAEGASVWAVVVAPWVVVQGQRSRD